MDWDAEGLLDGLDDGAREGRRKLLDALYERGVPIEELRTAVKEDRLVLLPIEHVLMGDPELSAHEVAEQAGLSLETLLAWQRLTGISPPEDLDAKLYTSEDLEAARRARFYVDSGLPLKDIEPVLRTLSSSMSRVAEAVRQIFAGAFLREGDTEYELAQRYASASEALTPMVVQDLEYLLRLNLREFTRHDALSVAERVSGELQWAVEVAVGFADFVGFTALGEEVLVDVADRLLELADEHVKRPARVIKSIGDAVMIVSREPQPLLDALLDLVAAAAADQDLPALRAGLTYGKALPRSGDWYGGTVNLAARLCQRARPDAVLTTEALRDALDGTAAQYQWSEAGPKRLKGIEEPVRGLRVRRASAP